MRSNRTHMHSPEPAGARSFLATSARALPRYAPFVALAATFAAMLCFSWGKWPDVLVDFGHELYAAWQLSQGKVLGRDIAWGATGPLSPYLNALLFALFGPGLRTLVVFNLLVLGALTTLLFVLLREVGDRFGAMLASFVFLTVFAFGQYVGIGNYNFVTPYSHGVTHGLFLSFLVLTFLWRHARTGAARDLVAATTCVGLVFLTKPEIFVACAGAVATAAIIRFRNAPSHRARALFSLALFVPPLVPPLIAFSLLALAATPSEALQATLAPWLGMTSPLVRTPFYLSGVGLDDPWGNLGRAAAWLGFYASVLVPAALADWRARSTPARRIGAAVAAAAVAAVGWGWVPLGAWSEVARPLPLLMAIGAAASFLLAWRTRPCPPSALLRASLSTFALLLLLKMALNARLYHYGFALAMPATLLLVSWLAASAPILLRERGGSGVIFRAVTSTVALVVVSAYLRYSSEHFAKKTEPVGTGADVFLADGRGAYVNAIVDAISRQAEAGATLAVIPEGVMINYLTRRETPSRFLTYMPDALARWGEDALLSPYRSSPPRFIVIVHRDATEHGAALFGRDYAHETFRWMRELYEPVATVGDSPFQPGGYGMLLLRSRRGDPPRQSPGIGRP